jgi:hypothetical protein
LLRTLRGQLSKYTDRQICAASYVTCSAQGLVELCTTNYSPQPSVIETTTFLIGQRNQLANAASLNVILISKEYVPSNDLTRTG